MTQATLTIAIVGDVHNQWDQRDQQALVQLKVDLVLFVGDFGNEAVEVVQQIAQIPLPMAVVCGNHDAWFSMTPWGLEKCPYDRSQEDRVQAQLEVLGETHVGYGKRDFPDWNLSVVGARPFSWGGSTWWKTAFYRDRWGVDSFDDSTALMMDVVRSTQCDTLIFIGHNGPLGLGAEPEDPCGKDWQPIGGDHGDPDFAEVLSKTAQLNKQVALVTFGHMHHTLRHTKTQQRRSLHLDQGDRSSAPTLYLNAARVPRVKLPETGESLHHFALVTLKGGEIDRASQAWVTPSGHVVEEEVLYQRTQ
ncbi:MAG: TIGR04168 family protein [Synechococcales bacterium]|nr:TIGR04168 family protein [Synechococcales bacterium]